MASRAVYPAASIRGVQWPPADHRSTRQTDQQPGLVHAVIRPGPPAQQAMPPQAPAQPQLWTPGLRVAPAGTPPAGMATYHPQVAVAGHPPSQSTNLLHVPTAGSQARPLALPVSRMASAAVPSRGASTAGASLAASRAASRAASPPISPAASYAPEPVLSSSGKLLLGAPPLQHCPSSTSLGASGQSLGSISTTMVSTARTQAGEEAARADVRAELEGLRGERSAARAEAAAARAELVQARQHSEALQDRCVDLQRKLSHAWGEVCLNKSGSETVGCESELIDLRDSGDEDEATGKDSTDSSVETVQDILWHFKEHRVSTGQKSDQVPTIKRTVGVQTHDFEPEIIRTLSGGRWLLALPPGGHARRGHGGEGEGPAARPRHLALVAVCACMLAFFGYHLGARSRAPPAPLGFALPGRRAAAAPRRRRLGA